MWNTHLPTLKKIWIWMLKETTWGEALKCLRREHCKNTVRERDSVKNCPARAACGGWWPWHGHPCPARRSGVSLTNSSARTKGIQAETVKLSPINHQETVSEFQAQHHDETASTDSHTQTLQCESLAIYNPLKRMTVFVTNWPLKRRMVV